MTIVGLVGAGHMGAGIGWALREGGHDVITSVAGRSARTVRLAAAAGITTVPRPEDVLQADVILVVTPPAASLTVVAQIADLAARVAPQSRAQSRTMPLVVDLNATSPATAKDAAAILTGSGLEFVDGSISGGPPTVRPGATIYLSGPRATDVASLHWTHVNPVVVSDVVGSASAVKMCTASVYKGHMALLTQAMRTAAANGVLELVLSDLGARYGSTREVALAAAKAHRYVDEMHEIAKTQAAAGLTPSLFEAMAEVWADVANTELADDNPEAVRPSITAQEVVDGLRTAHGRASTPDQPTAAD
jgi:3-hydroxyisobutyrate dehydrogenase-like beta-hydroxyacid dehydrogenase